MAFYLAQACDLNFIRNGQFRPYPPSFCNDYIVVVFEVNILKKLVWLENEIILIVKTTSVRDFYSNHSERVEKIEA